MLDSEGNTAHTHETAMPESDLTIDPGRRQVTQGGRLVKLPKLSYRMFAALVEASPDVLTHDDLVDRVWNGRSASVETVTQRVMLVRRALGDDANNPRYIGLVRGQGYRMLQTVRTLATKDADSRPITKHRPQGAGNDMQRIVVAATAALTLVIATVAGYRLTESTPGTVTFAESRLPTIAVLPLTNQGTESGDAYLADGIHANIVASLASIDSLRVISRNSMEQFRNTDRSSREIGAALGAVAILEGNVQRSGERIQIDVQFIATVDEASLFVKSFDEELTVENMYSIQKDIAEAVARSMQSALPSGEQSRVASAPTQNMSAYEAYLRGTQLLRRRTGPSIEAAILNFKEAIRHDAEFAAPFVGLADGYQLLPSYAARPAAEMLPLALYAAETAIDLDPEDGSAYASLAMIHFEARKLPVAVFPPRNPEPLFRRAIELSPNYATAFQWYGEFLSSSGRPYEAIAYYSRAEKMDPSSPILNHVYAYTLMSIGREDEAEQRFLMAIEADPGFSRAYQGLGTLYYFQGRLVEAILSARQAALLNPGEAINFVLLSDLFLSLGDTSQAERWLAEAERLEPNGRHAARIATMLHVHRGTLADAFDRAHSALASAPLDRRLLSVLKDQYLRDRDVDSALQLYQRSLPNLQAAGYCARGMPSCWLMIDYAQLLLETDRRAEAKALLQQAQKELQRSPIRKRPRTLVMQAAIHAVNDDPRSALDILAMAVERGWRRSTFYYFQRDSIFRSIRNEPDFQLLAAEVRDDLSRQRRELQAQTGAELVVGGSGTATNHGSPL